MSNPINMLRYRAKLSRSSFDMGQSLAFTASTGMILPIYSDLLNAGESVHYSTDFFARTQPLVTAAMADVDVYLDWFFVPCTMLYTAWGQIRFQTRDFVSSFYETAQTPSGSGTTLYGTPAIVGGFPVLASSSFSAPIVSGSATYSQPGIFSRSNSSASSLPNVNDYEISAYVFGNSFDYASKAMFRMLDLLGYNPCGVFGEDTTSNLAKYNPNTFPYKALAYQAIYQHWFRNDDYETLDVSSYNWDRFYNNPLPVSLSISSTATRAYSPEHPFILRYCDYRKDYFTSVKPSPLMSSINMLPTTSSGTVLASVNNFLSNTEPSPSNTQGNGTPLGAGTQNLTSTQSGIFATSQNKLNVGSLRSLFAVEKLIRITGRAAKDYDSQVLAHFGYNVPHDVKHELTHLHSIHGMLHIGEVVSTADTYSGSNGTALGEIAGKGYVSIHENGKKKFTAPVDGVLMCTFRAVPRVRVVGSFDRQNSVAYRTDLYIPEFDKLGMQPLYNYEMSAGVNSTDYVGWKLRYSQYKEKYDRASYVFSVPETGVINQYSAWILGYKPLQDTGASGNTLSLAMQLKCPPTALNNIMAIPYQTAVSTTFNSNPAADFYTDPFICDFRANVTKVSTMSPTGEPDMVSL
nr:MAG: major capsid protein [Microviridae sp.]